MHVAHDVDAVRLVVPVVRVPYGLDVRADLPGGWRKGAVRHRVARPCELLRFRGERRAMYRERARMREHRDEIRARLDEVHDERRIARRPDAERLRRLSTRDDIGRVDDRFQHQRVLRSGCGIDEAAEGRDEVLGDQPVAIRPPRGGPQSKCIAAAVFGNGPALRSTRDGAAVRSHRDESLVAVAKDRHRRFHARELRVDGVGLAAIAAAKLRRRIVGASAPAGDERPHREHRGEDEGKAALHAARARFLRCTRRMEIVAAVMPGRREAWPSVPGRDSIRRWRASFESPATVA